MSTAVINAEQKNSLVSTYTVTDLVKIDAPGIGLSTGSLCNSFVKVPALNGGVGEISLHGRTVQNMVERTGKWKFAMTRVKFKFVSTDVQTKYGFDFENIGINIADQTLSTMSSSMFSQSSESLVTGLDLLNIYRKYGMLERAQLLDVLTELPITGLVVSGTVYCTYIPAIFPSFEAVSNNWDLATIEPLSLRTTFKSPEVIGLGVGTEMFGGSSDGSGCDLFIGIVDYDPSYTAKLFTATFRNGEDNVNFLSYDSELQIYPLGVTSTAITSAKIKITFNSPSYATSVFIRPRNRPAGVTGSGTPKFLNIRRADISFSSNPYITDIPTKVTSFSKDIVGCGSVRTRRGAAGAVLYDDNKPHTFTWCERPTDRLSFSGALAWGSQINSPTLEIFFPSTDPTGWEVVVENKYYCDIQMKGLSGVLTKSISG